MINEGLRLINLYLCLQGSVGFLGLAGASGEKGRRVRTVLAFYSISHTGSLIYLWLLSVFVNVYESLLSSRVTDNY